MNDQRCGNCRFFNKEAYDPESGKGNCMRFPPFVVSTPAARTIWMTVFPEVHNFHWCGEWKAAETPTSDKLQDNISKLNLSVRAHNVLESYGPSKYDVGLPRAILTIGDLVQFTAERLLEQGNFGPVLLKEVREKLALLGLKLKDD